MDITPEMVAWGREKAAKQGVSLSWVVADARTFQLQQQFRFIYMLEHVFQFMLTNDDLEAMLARVREHLHPEGCFLFDTRNPSPRNLYEPHHPEPRQYTAPDGRQLIVTEEQQYDPLTQIQHFTRHLTFLQPDGQRNEKVQRTSLHYVFPQEMEALLFHSGLRVRACYGNWQQEPLTADSREMIYVCQRRR